MPRQYWPAVMGLAVFALAAVAVAGYMVAAGRIDPALAAGGLLLLAAGQLGLILAAMLKVARLEDWIAHHQQLIRSLLAKAEAADTRLQAIEKRPAPVPDARIGEIAADMRALRESIRGLGRTPEAPPPPQAAPIAPKPQSRTLNERLELLLEPIVELASGATSHYRALLDLADDNGHAVRHDELMLKADQGGMRPALDAHMVRLVAPVLRRLRQRNPALRAFVPIGIATLNSAEESSRILAIIEHEADVASGLVFEFRHESLGRLDNTGIAALAKLGRLGATMALSEVQVSGLDLAALRQLGVRFLSFAPAAAGGGSGPSPAWREFVQYARAMQFQIVIADIDTALQASAAAQAGRYGFGPFFAPPRKVRADAGQNGFQRRTEAA